MSNCVMIWFCEGDARRAPGMDLLTVGTPTWSTTPACLLLWSASSPESGWHAKKTCTSAADWSAKRRRCYRAIDSQRLCWKLPCQYWKRQPGYFLVSPDLKFNVIWQLVNLDKLPSKNSVKNRKETFFSAYTWTFFFVRSLGNARISPDQLFGSGGLPLVDLAIFRPAWSRWGILQSLLAWSHYRRKAGLIGAV